jgi:hypothetical protein
MHDFDLRLSFTAFVLAGLLPALLIVWLTMQ